MKPLWIPQSVSIAMLLWALNPSNPYGYYVLLRWICCPVSAYAALQAFRQGREQWGWVLGVMSALYNPILPLHLTREVWTVVNLITIGIAIRSVFVLKVGDASQPLP
jgi:hypothetical protein